jgi:competence protein ComEA
VGDRPSFRPERPPAKSATSDRRFLALLAVACLLGLVLFLRSSWEPRVPAGTLVEVVGEVPRPGMHRLDLDPTVAEAVEAAGGQSAGLPATPLHEGDRVVVTADGVHVAPSGNPLLVALPVDVNSADAGAFEAIPGVGAELARAIVAEREQNGAFRTIEDLDRVPGLTAARIEEIRPFLVVDAAGPVDVNTATAAELEQLPGIGPVLAARIVVDREDNGPYRSLDDLTRVKGIGPEAVERLRHHAVAGS